MTTTDPMRRSAAYLPSLTLLCRCVVITLPSQSVLRRVRTLPGAAYRIRGANTFPICRHVDNRERDYGVHQGAGPTIR